MTIKDLEKPEQLIDRLPAIRLIQEPVELSRRRSESTDDLALSQRRGGDAFLRFERQLIQEEISQVVRILVVLENIFDVDGALPAGLQDIRKSFRTQFPIDVHVRDGIIGCRDRRHAERAKSRALQTLERQGYRVTLEPVA